MSSRSLNTMLREKKGYQDSLELLRRSEKGLWVRGEIKGEGIIISCHRRHEVRGNTVFEVDPDGDVKRSGHVHGFDWGDPWEEIGEINLTDEIAGMCNPIRFGVFCSAMMRHAVSMIIEGYGDCPGDVIQWFRESGMTYMDGVDFLFERDSGQFTGLTGRRAHVTLRVGEEGPAGMLATIGVDQSEFEVDLVSNDSIVDFVIATSPV